MPERYIKLPNHNWYPEIPHHVDRNDLTAQQLYKTDQEITFDGGRWGIVKEVVGSLIWVTDEDGGEHELIEGRID